MVLPSSLNEKIRTQFRSAQCGQDGAVKRLRPRREERACITAIIEAAAVQRDEIVVSRQQLWTAGVFGPLDRTLLGNASSQPAELAAQITAERGEVLVECRR